MSWLIAANDRKIRFKGDLEKSKVPPKEYAGGGNIPKYDIQGVDYVPKDPNVRDIYRLTDAGFNKWEKENPGKSHFLMTHFIDNIYKVHRPGKLTYRRANVPIEEISEWCRQAKSQNVLHAFVLLPDSDLDQYFALYSGSKKIKSGKEVLFSIYDAYGIKPHHCPIQDFGTPTMARTTIAVEDLKRANDEAGQKGGKVVVHCSAGIGRTGLITSCYLVYTNRLSTNDVRALISSSSQSGGMYSQNKSLSDQKLSEMQKKVWFDTISQLKFIKNFSKIKDAFDKVGKSMADESSLMEIRQYDERKAKEEAERLANEKKKIQKNWESLPSTQKFVSPKGGLDEYWRKKYGDDLTDDDIEVLKSYTQKTQKDDLGELTEQEQLELDMMNEDYQRQLDFDVPPFDEAVEDDPIKAHEEIEKQELKRRSGGKRDYLGKIPVTCPECSSKLLFPSEFAGEYGSCPTCAAAVPIPDINETTTSTSPVQSHSSGTQEFVSPTTSARLFKDDIHIKCPKCKKDVYIYRKNDDKAGRKLKCIHCRNIFNLSDGIQPPELKVVPAPKSKKTKQNPKLELSPKGDEAYYRKIKEIEYEPMEDEEWLRRFSTNFNSLEKKAYFDSGEGYSGDDLGWAEKYRYKYPVTPTPYVSPPVISKVDGIEGLYRGKRPGYPTRTKIDDETVIKYAQEMKKAGITDVLVLLSAKELQNYYDNRLEEIYKKEGLITHFYSIDDFGTPSLEKMMEIVFDMYNVLNKGGNLLVHCSAGIGRTGTVIAAYSIWADKQNTSLVQSAAQQTFLNKWKKLVGGEPVDMKEETKNDDKNKGTFWDYDYEY
jgi:protein-tyrosine phosphatase/DNA-directed RNA polymerase subunit M/transcription elongation factor TFIIS